MSHQFVMAAVRLLTVGVLYDAGTSAEFDDEVHSDEVVGEHELFHRAIERDLKPLLQGLGRVRWTELPAICCSHSRWCYCFNSAFYF
jgi:thiamine biosynthesis protein ThiC